MLIFSTLRKICQSNMLRIESLYSACKKPAPEYYKSVSTHYLYIYIYIITNINIVFLIIDATFIWI